MNITELKAEFVRLYGGSREDIRVFASPGRVNLIGEHTDYNGGFVFPAALNMNTTVLARLRPENKITLKATDLPDVIELDIDRLDEYKGLKWGNYQAGVAKVMREAEYTIPGLYLLYQDTVPHGGGLSSSAAIEVATALTIATFSKEITGTTRVDMIELAKLGQKAENQYVGVNCGIMDQFASAMGRAEHAIFLDCKDLSYKHVPVKLGEHKIVIANTNKKRSLADSKYNERRAECEEALKLLQAGLPGKYCLGEINAVEFEQHRHLIDNPVIMKRARHVIEEDDRVLKSVIALENGDLNAFGRLMRASHESVEDLYEVTGIELDTLVAEALKINGVLGSRMTGAGFGGCTVSIVREDAIDGFIANVGEEYTTKIGYAPSFYISEAGDGGREIV